MNSENQECFKKTAEAINKLRIAAKNTAIQMEVATQKMKELSYIAESLGYRIDKDGSLCDKK